MATGVRDWATCDFYGMLGVAVDASADDIARAFRTAAKTAHPDATDDPAAVERFKDLAAAYSVLSDPRTRREYDRVRAATPIGGTRPTSGRPVAAAASGPAASGPVLRSRARAGLAVLAGTIVVLGGLVAAAVTLTVHRSESAERARTVAVTAERISGGRIVFLDGSGRRIITTEPARKGDPRGSGPTVDVRYDPAAPERVVVATSSVGRDLTLAGVAAKLLIGGTVVVVIGARALIRFAR
ncbi:MAG: J domain-containing protein [Actinomycetota bacterium]